MAKLNTFYGPNYTDSQTINKGIWKILGTDPALAEKIGMPLLRVVGDIYDGNDVIGKVYNKPEYAHAQELTSAGRFFIEELLRVRFGILPN